MMDALRQDIRYALRSLAKAPGFTAVVLLTLALGIGANTAIFSVVNGVLLRPLPYYQPERLTVVRETYGEGQRGTVSGPNYLDWRTRNRSFEQLAASRVRMLTVLGEGEPEEVTAAFVSYNFFTTLGLPPVLGRGFAPREDEGEGSVAVLGDGFWRTHYGADPHVVGRTLTLSSKPYTIVGVAPKGLNFPGQSQVYVPLELGVGRTAQRSSHSIDVLGRLKPGVTLDAAQAEFSRLTRDLEREHPAENTGRGAELTALTSDTLGPVRPALLLLSGAVTFVLLIACANVANLFLARAAARQREIAVRAAIGASRWRLARGVLVEAIILAVTGGVLGLLLASWGVDLLLALRPRGIPRLQEISIDGTALVFTLVVSALVGIGFGLFPALTLSRHDPADSIRGEGRGTSEGRRRVRFRSALVIAQVSLALVLLVGAALLVVTVRRLTLIEPGFEPEHAVVFSLPISAAKYPHQTRHTAYVDRIVSAIRAAPEVQTVGTVFFMPLDNGDVNGDFNFEGQPPPPPGQEPYAGYRIVSGDYFAALGVPLRHGRLFTPEDIAGAPRVALVNEAFVRRFVPSGNPLGKRITFGDGTEDAQYHEIVGVVADVRHQNLTADPGPEIYVPYAQVAPDLWGVFSAIPLSVVVRTKASVESVAPGLRDAVLQADPEQVISGLRPAGELISDAIARQRFSMLLLLAFGGLALTLAAVGVYGVLAYTVSQRTRELGIRLALGARAAAVRALVLRQGLTMAFGGILLGLVCALVLGRLLAGLLYGVSAADPLVLGAVALLLGTASAFACLVPAIRATRVSPMDALRSE
jgi:putative ABC transport system permease protein